MNLFSFFSKSSSTSRLFKDDKHFDKLYPEPIRQLTRPHWTPLIIAKAASDYLAAEGNVRILDIGSGVGKFCLAAGYYQPSCHFYGVEQRAHLIEFAEAAKQKSGINNATFIHSNIKDLDFSGFDHFYFFNSFYENLQEAAKIDYLVDHSQELYNEYSTYLFTQLNKLPAGTRLCTYFGTDTQLPLAYELLKSLFDEKLKYWVKQ